ncbi:endoglucanase [Dysgonomonas sp. PFB1-18]|uniref:glycoside hydrolase family 5 protein n=1 Tax=unclassified Dysgonomonas TaxID=2630389 RepID=UPI002473D6F5|nr:MULTISPECIES: glycoside hydrolase family 5 protein [unclassified Dysgonomonas]MDH6310528.1 endoglucanase [Dysgonomonas sp. PF1-14]MDH6340378.1 endoglucanase [Dysgonomonas sp. PF1-16]MDH6382042.1 endoglucanase [Dysgonomonas sp. PFB1-18]MDH6399349.1 endoglucanase [Dysgonomonas sp. PF1-23]
MRKVFCIIGLALTLFSACQQTKSEPQLTPESFIRIDGQNLITPNGEKLFIKGTNLGNWLNPEGYMFSFGKASSAGFINDMFCQLVGPDRTAEFWKLFKDNYITQEDLHFIKQTGSNTVRLPFHYKLFTDEDYMGLTANQDGFARIDTLISWCKQEGLYLILDMHDAPGGQTGDNIDDSYGYPWLFESETSQKLYCDIWRKIADYYKNEPTILGFELFNEPIAPYFENMEELNGKLETIYKMGVAAIREVNTNHIILLGGAQWNGNFKPFKDSKFDNKIMYTCHRYGSEPTAEAIKEIINFRDSVNLPMYMGEIGHNTDEWMAAFCKTMADNNIGWTFWPYKKIHNSSFAGIKEPEGWDKVKAFSEAPRGSFKEIREARPNQEEAWKSMLGFIENSKFKNNVIQKGYISALGLKPE